MINFYFFKNNNNKIIHIVILSRSNIKKKFQAINLSKKFHIFFIIIIIMDYLDLTNILFNK